MEEDILKDKTLLIVDDEVDLRDIVASELEFMGAKVFQAENITKAQAVLNENQIDLVVSDIRMPGGTGIDLLGIIKGKDVQKPPVILITGFADITVEDAFNKGAEALVNKPFKLDDLIKMVVRHTSTYSERFQEGDEPTKSITAENVSGVKFGRGGAALDISTGGQRYDLGDVVVFEFSYNGQKYKGTGICRWFNPVENANQKGTVGIEFINLDQDTLSQFQKMNDGKVIVPYIPSSN